jgi:Mg-chelatase subunit ChlD
MRRLLLVLLICWLPTASPAATLVKVVAPERELTRNVIVIVDTSGSMSGRRIGAAISAVGMLMRRPEESYQLKLVAFRDKVHVWPRGWVEMPSPGSLEAAQRWLASLGGEYGAAGETFVTPAIRLALQEEREDLSIVLISDGSFTFGGGLVNLSFEVGQKLRRERKLGEAVLMCIGIGRSHPHLEALGRMGKGGVYVIKEKRKLGQLPEL